MREKVARAAQPEDIGALAVFLCREEARNVNGANWSMDGGWTAE